MPQINSATALRLLNEAMPGMEWKDWGRAGMQTSTELTKVAANKLMESLKNNVGISDDAEPEVSGSDKRSILVIQDPSSITGEAWRRLADPVVKAKLQADTAGAKAESEGRDKLQASHTPATLENIVAPPTSAALSSTDRNRTR